MNQVPKRRLSLFSFGSSSNTNNTNSVSSGSTGQTSVNQGPNSTTGSNSGPGSSGIGFGLGKGRTLSALSPTSLSRRNTSTNATPASTNGASVTGSGDSKVADGAFFNVAGAGHSGSAPGQKLTVNTTSSTEANKPDVLAPRSNSTSSGNQQLQSPVNSPSMSDNELNIFERSVQDYDSQIPPPYSPSHDGSRRPTLSRLKTKSGHNSSISLSHFKNEDYIPPALDATTSILNDSKTNLDDVDIIYCTRRNSSVLGLNMALGRSTPSRKNSVYSMSQLHHQATANPHNMTSANASISPNCNCNNDSVNNNSCRYTIPESKQADSPSIGEASPSIQSNSNGYPVPINQDQNTNSMLHPMSPTSPPKLTSSKSSISFYSYADMINNDEYAKRPSFKNSYSHGVVPTRKDSVSSIKLNSGANSTTSETTGTPSHFNSANSKKFNTSLNKFLISPESSDSEDELGSKPKSINGKSLNDNESLVSSSVGDCLRQNKTEISNV